MNALQKLKAAIDELDEYTADGRPGVHVAVIAAREALAELEKAAADLAAERYIQTH